MARSKQTARAEARRRYRASLEADAVATNTDEAIATPNRLTSPASPNQVRSGGPGVAARRAKPADPLAVPPVTPRAGFLGALSASVTPLDLRGDLVALPALVTRSRAVWLPSLITAVCGLIILVPSIRSNEIVALVASVFIYPTPMAGPFLAGILAPRAGWLAGAIVAIVGAVFQALLLASATSTDLTRANLSPADRNNAILFAIGTAPLLGAFLGSFSAFYRRFLRMTNANAARRASARQSARAKPAARGTEARRTPAPKR